jgi:hypothetical protein
MYSKAAPPAKGQVVWLHPLGKESVWAKGTWNPEAKAIVDAGYVLLAVDLFGSGEAASDKFRVNKEFAGYTYGYNRSLLGHRVHDALLAVRQANAFDKDKNPPVHLVGWGEFGPIAILAKALRAMRSRRPRPTSTGSSSRTSRTPPTR